MRPSDTLARIELAERKAARWAKDLMYNQREKRRIAQMGLPFYKRDYFYLKLSGVIVLIAYVTTLVLIL